MFGITTNRERVAFVVFVASLCGIVVFGGKLLDKIERQGPTPVEEATMTGVLRDLGRQGRSLDANYAAITELENTVAQLGMALKDMTTMAQKAKEVASENTKLFKDFERRMTAFEEREAMKVDDVVEGPQSELAKVALAVGPEESQDEIRAAAAAKAVAEVAMSLEPDLDENGDLRLTMANVARCFKFNEIHNFEYFSKYYTVEEQMWLMEALGDNLNEKCQDLGVIIAAIGIAENGRPGFRFGITTPGVDTFRSQAGHCAATVRKNAIRYFDAASLPQRLDFNQGKYDDFISFLGSRYCPIGADNDPTGLNKNWIPNVREKVAKLRKE